MASRAAAGALKKRFTRSSVPGQKFRYRIISGDMRAMERGVCLIVQKRDDVGNLIIFESGEARHTFVGPPVADDRFQGIAPVIAQRDRRTQEIGSARSGRIVAMTKTTARLKKRPPASDGGWIFDRLLARLRNRLVSLTAIYKTGDRAQEIDDQTRKAERRRHRPFSISNQYFQIRGRRNAGEEVLCLSHAAQFVLRVNVYENLDQPSTVASLIDHTLLKPESSKSDIQRLCDQAKQHRFASVCVNPCWVALAAEELAGAGIAVCTVIGFPLGANETRTKLFEAELALSRGATELDAVQNIGALLSGDLALAAGELGELARLAQSRGALLKAILETCLLTAEQKQLACTLAVRAGADFVKTSTGFAREGATPEDVALMRRAVGESAGVKASGGIRTLTELRAMVRAGATRIGTSSGVQILRQLQSGSFLDSASDITSKAAY